MKANSHLPFLYETYTLRSSSPHPKVFRCRLSGLYSTLRKFPDETAQAFAPSDRDDFSNRASRSTESNHPKVRMRFVKEKTASATSARIRRSLFNRKSTLTPAEKFAFDKLLEKLESGANPEEKIDSSPKEENRRGPHLKTPHSRGPDDAELPEISSIFNETIKDLKEGDNQGTEAKKAAKDTLNPREPQEICRFKISDATLSERMDLNRVSYSRLIEMVVQRESEKIEMALQRAVDEGKGDSGVWRICEEHMFGMLAQLGVNDGSKLIDSPSRVVVGNPATQSAARSSVELADVFKSPSDDKGSQANLGILQIPPFVPTSPVISALYSHLLLFTLRLLKAHFPNSPILSQIRPTIKSFGRASVVLGGSTSLYNELVMFYWRACDDLPAVVSLLREMEVTGINPDANTYKLVKGIIAARNNERKEHHEQMRHHRQQPNTVLWDTEPNKKALDALVGSELQPGWVRRIETRLQEIHERQRIERDLRDKTDWDCDIIDDPRW